MKFGLFAKKRSKFHSSCYDIFCILLRSGLKTSDYVREQGVPRIETRVSERTRKYVSISIRGTTQVSDIRWGFKTTSKHLNDYRQRDNGFFYAQLWIIAFRDFR